MPKASIPFIFAVALVPVALRAQTPVGELFAGEASVKGSVILAASGTSVLSGSQVSAGQSAAVLKLHRGGELRVCPRTSLSVNASPTGEELMIGFNTGSLELHYTLANGSDTVMTPDFRIQMIGPGSFHLALAADSAGTTCVRPLKGDEAGVIVSEIMGGGSYQVGPDSPVIFAKGRIEGAKKDAAASCGCPAPEAPIVPAATTKSGTPPPSPPEQKLPPETHLEMDTPMVYEGGSQAPVYSTSRLTASQSNREPSAAKQQAETPAEKSLTPPAATTVEPAKSSVAARPAEKRSWFRRLGHFFAKSFGNG